MPNQHKGVIFNQISRQWKTKAVGNPPGKCKLGGLESCVGLWDREVGVPIGTGGDSELLWDRLWAFMSDTSWPPGGLTALSEELSNSQLALSPLKCTCYTSCITLEKYALHWSEIHILHQSKVNVLRVVNNTNITHVHYHLQRFTRNLQRLRNLLNPSHNSYQVIQGHQPLRPK